MKQMIKPDVDRNCSIRKEADIIVAVLLFFAYEIIQEELLNLRGIKESF